MKKLTVIILTLAIILNISLSAFAMPTVNQNFNRSITVSGMTENILSNVSIIVYKGEVSPANMLYIGQTKSDATKNYEHTLLLPETTAEATYTLATQEEGQPIQTTEFDYRTMTMELYQTNNKVSVRGNMDASNDYSIIVYEKVLNPLNTKYIGQGKSDKDGIYTHSFELGDDCYDKTFTLLIQQSGKTILKSEFKFRFVNDIVWWHNVLKISCDNEISLGADVFIGSNAGWDAGQGAFYTASELAGQAHKTRVANWEKAGIRRIGWIEGCGDTRVMALGLYKNEDGTYKTNSNSGAAEIIATPWNWASTAANANEYVWTGAAAMVNGDAYQGEYVWPDDAMQPTYPDGTGAKGWLNSDTSDPRNYKLYDAMAEKKLDGTVFISEASILADTDTHDFKIYTTDENKNGYTRNFYFSKDMASPWWIEYNRLAVRRLIESGIDGFWVDNYNGWNYAHTWQPALGYGDWSVALFKDYLKEHPELGVADPDNFNIRTYMQNKNYSYNNAQNDPIWYAYSRAFKADILAQRMSELYNVIKEEAVRAGKNPDDILVMGNDIAKTAYGGERGVYLDMVATEYTSQSNPAFNYSYNDGIAPEGYSAVMYKTAASMGAFNRANIWQYREKNEGPEIAKIYGYEALANNTSLYLGASSTSKNHYGDETSTRKIFATIDAVAELFGARESDANILLYYSPQSMASSKSRAIIPHKNEFNGWGFALEDAKIPYKVLPEYKINSETLADIDLLIMPGVNSISDDMINNCIVPYIQKGGKVIVTGEDAGLLKTSAEMYEKRSNAALAQLAQQYPDNAFYSAATIGTTYYTAAERNSLEIYMADNAAFATGEDFVSQMPVFTRKDGNVSANVKITSNRDGNVTACAYLASYDGNRLVDITTKYITLTAGETTEFNFEPVKAAAEERIFVWTSSNEPASISLTADMFNTASDIGKLMQKANITPDVKMYGFGEKVILSTHRYDDAKRCYVDIVNRDIDANEVITASKGGTVKVKLPYEYSDVTCVITNADDDITRTADFAVTADGYVEVYVPSFTNYISLVFMEN